MERNKTFKILAIDGGGIKGLYSASILKRFEEKFNCLTSNHFDVVCGTSTGGLIALAIASKLPANEICNFYEEKGELIFPKYKEYWVPLLGKINYGFMKQIALGGKYSNEGLKSALKEIFNERKLGDSNNLLCIPSYSVTEAKPKVFKYDHKEGELSRDNDALMVDIALATSAAPTYFPMAELNYYNNEQFIDGGVWANNPALVGLLEALSCFVGKGREYNRISILSLSSLSITGGKSTGLKNERSFKDWGPELFETAMTGQSFFTDFFLKKVKDISDIEIDYLRIPSVSLSKDQESLIQLDLADEHAYNLMKIKAEEQALIFEKDNRIKELFQNKKTYNLN
jgi:patatin-like phospholipase/acyl hydrolase